MYLSQVNDVMVKMVALVDVSERRPCMMQTISSKGYELGSQMFKKSNGIPTSAQTCESQKEENFHYIFLADISCSSRFVFRKLADDKLRKYSLCFAAICPNQSE